MSERHSPRSELPAGDDPWLWVEGRQLVVSTGSQGVPGGYVGVHVNWVTDELAGEFDFHVEVDEVDPQGRPVALIEEVSRRTSVSRQMLYLLNSELPEKAPAWYRIKTSVSRVGFSAERCAYVAVPEQIVEAELLPANTVVRAGEAVVFTLVNTGPTTLSFSDKPRLHRHDGENRWTMCGLGPEKLIARGLKPGGRREETLVIPTNARPGRYRISRKVQGVGTRLERRVSFECQVNE